MSSIERYRARLEALTFEEATTLAERLVRSARLSRREDEGDAIRWDDPQPAVWISFVDPFGSRRDDAVVYAVELVRDPDGTWVIEVTVARDHCPKAELLAHLDAVLDVRFVG